MRHAGFTLIEVLVTLVLVAILSTIAVPTMTVWVANARVQGVAEQLQNALRLTQSEAMRRGRQTVFVLTNATPAVAATPAANGSNWYLQSLPLLNGEAVSDSTAYIQGSSLNSDARATITGPAVTCFSSFGRQVSNTATGLGSNCTAQTQTYSVTAGSISGARNLKVTVSVGGQIRMCDAARTLSATTPDGC